MELKLAGSPSGPSEIKNKALEGPLNDLFNSGYPSNVLAVFLPKLVGLAFVVGSVIFLFMFIIGAIQWISSGGDKSALEGARGRISNALIGLVLLFISFAVIKLIEAFFGVNILTIDIGPLII